MKKYSMALILCEAVMLSACHQDYVNSPRETATMKSNILTTVTTEIIIPEDTYSEYKSMLAESTETSPVQSVGAVPDTAISPIIQSETAITETGGSDEAAVTSAPISEEEVTATCETTAPLIPLENIPTVPSENVVADTALSISD